MDQEIISLLQETILAGWNNTNPNVATYPPMFNTLIQQQTQIDWLSLTKGFWSLEWEKFNNSILQKQTTSKQEPQTWLESVLALLWSNFFNLWKIRNKHNHGCDSAKKVICYVNTPFPNSHISTVSVRKSVVSIKIYFLRISTHCQINQLP